MTFSHLLLVGAGGFAGSIARFFLSIVMMNRFPGSFPYGTLVVNLAGCFLLGVLVGMSPRTGGIDHRWKLLLGTGFCGGFTTFSAFAIENVMLIHEKLTTVSVWYTLVSLVGGILAAAVGVVAGRLAAP